MQISTWTPDKTTPMVLVVVVAVVPRFSLPLRAPSPSFFSTQTDGFLVTDTIWDDLLCRRLQGRSTSPLSSNSNNKMHEPRVALWRENGRIAGSEEKRRPGTVFGIKSQ